MIREYFAGNCKGITEYSFQMFKSSKAGIQTNNKGVISFQLSGLFQAHSGPSNPYKGWYRFIKESSAFFKVSLAANVNDLKTSSRF